MISIFLKIWEIYDWIIILMNVIFDESILFLFSFSLFRFHFFTIHFKLYFNSNTIRLRWFHKNHGFLTWRITHSVFVVYVPQFIANKSWFFFFSVRMDERAERSTVDWRYNEQCKCLGKIHHDEWSLDGRGRVPSRAIKTKNRDLGRRITVSNKKGGFPIL